MPSSEASLLQAPPEPALPGGRVRLNVSPQTAPRPVRVVAVVRNPVTSDFRVLKTCRLIQQLGYESAAIGWTNCEKASSGRDETGMEIQRAQSGHRCSHAFRLCHALHKSPLPFREFLETTKESWIRREIDRLPRILPSPSQIPKPDAAVHPERGDLVTSKVLRQLFDRAKRAIRSFLQLTRLLLQRLGAFSHPGFLAGELQRRKMMLCVAETFWDLYPLLLDSRPDVIHAHELSALLPAIVAGRKLGVPVIYDSHELEFARNSPWGPETFAFWREHERDLIRFADAVIAVSDGCASALQERYSLRKDSVSVVRNCPSEHRKQPPRGLRDTLGLPDTTPLLVFVGKLTRNRGLDLMIQVLRKLPRFHLACVGHEDPAYRRSLERDAIAAGVRDRISFVPPVAGNEVVNFISGADLSVMPIRDVCLSYRYCLPNKLFESAHAAVPVVASALPDMQSFMDHYAIGEAVEGEDPDHWARAIERNYHRRHTFFTPAKIERIRIECSAEGEVAKVGLLYRRILTDTIALPS